MYMRDSIDSGFRIWQHLQLPLRGNRPHPMCHSKPLQHVRIHLEIPVDNINENMKLEWKLVLTDSGMVCPEHEGVRSNVDIEPALPPCTTGAYDYG